MLDNVELIMHMKFQNILTTGCSDMNKKPQKCPQNQGFPLFVTPNIFFKNRALSILYTYGALTSSKTRQVYNGPRVVKFITAIRTRQVYRGPRYKNYFHPHLH